MAKQVDWRVLLLLPALASLFIAFDGLHYWHDVRFLVVSTQFGLEDILSGKYNPHEAWTEMSEKAVGGFYQSKILHILILKSFFSFISPGDGGFVAAEALSAVWVVLGLMSVYFLALCLTENKRLAGLTTLSLLLMPIIPYITAKMLSEAPSFLFTTLAILFLIQGMKTSRRVPVVYGLAASLFLTCACLTRIDSIIGPIGFMVALLACPVMNMSRLRTVFVFSFVLCITGIGYLASLVALGADPSNLFLYLNAFVSAGQKSQIMSLFGIISFGGMMYILFLTGLFSTQKKLVVFFVLWLLLCMVPVIFLTSAYMVEPRYLMQSAIPLASICALGFKEVVNWLEKQSRQRRLALVVISSVSIFLFNAITVQLMPYELDRHALKQALQNIRAEDANAAILIPWSYTDFNYLQLVQPEDVFNVNSPPASDIPPKLNGQWVQRYRSWYGDSYVKDQADLRRLSSYSSIYYLGWKSYPPIQSIVELAQQFGFGSVGDRLKGLNLLNHLEQSWLWGDSRLSLEPAGKAGQYYYYKVLGVGATSSEMEEGL